MSEVPLYSPRGGCGIPLSSEYSSTSLTRKRTPLGPYRRPMSRVLGGGQGGGRFLMNEVPLYGTFETVKSRFWPWLGPLSVRKSSGPCQLFPVRSEAAGLRGRSCTHYGYSGTSPMKTPTPLGTP